MALFQYWRK